MALLGIVPQSTIFKEFDFLFEETKYAMIEFPLTQFLLIVYFDTSGSKYKYVLEPPVN